MSDHIIELIYTKYEMHKGKSVNFDNNNAYIKPSKRKLIINLRRDSIIKEKTFAGDIFKIGERP